MSNLLAIDPGPEQSAYVLIDVGDGFMDGLKIIESAKIPSSEIVPQVRSLFPEGTSVACEHLQCFGMAVGAEVFETAYWIGSIRQACQDRKIPFHKILRSEVKSTLCHSARATDANIRQALLDRWGGKDTAIGKKIAPGPLYGVKNDMWSALAVAVTWLDKQKARI